jgi:hypothetical protein
MYFMSNLPHVPCQVFGTATGKFTLKESRQDLAQGLYDLMIAYIKGIKSIEGRFEF